MCVFLPVCPHLPRGLCYEEHVSQVYSGYAVLSHHEKIAVAETKNMSSVTIFENVEIKCQ